LILPSFPTRRSSDLDVESLELEAPHRKARDILVRHAQPDRHAVEAAARLDGALELADVLGADELKLHEPRECVLEIRHFLGDHLDRKSTRLNSSHVA